MGGAKYSITTPALAYLPRNLWDDGRLRIMGSQERPQVLVDEETGYATHVFFATNTRLTNTSGACRDSKFPVSDACDFWNMVWPLRTSHELAGERVAAESVVM